MNKRQEKIQDEIIKGMKNKNISRKDKILARVEYEKQLYKNN